MSTGTGHVDTARQVVERYLDFCQERRTREAESLLAPGAILEFPPGVRHSSVRAVIDGGAHRYRNIAKNIEAWRCATASNGVSLVVCSGTLHGVDLSGRAFEGVRFIDVFEVADRAITSQRVWNDLAEAGILYAPQPEKEHLPMPEGPRVRVENNERERPGQPAKPLGQVQAEALRFAQREAGFAQVFSINRSGFPVGRTMGAPVEDDWTVTLIQRRVHRRIGQLRRDPRIEIVWVGAAAPESVNDRPHVFDFGLQVPRVVFLRGRAEFMGDAWTVEHFNLIQDRLRTRGHSKAPQRSAEDVRTNLIGIRVRPIQVRAEGFDTGARSFTWKIASDR